MFVSCGSYINGCLNIMPNVGWIGRRITAFVVFVTSSVCIQLKNCHVTIIKRQGMILL